MTEYESPFVIPGERKCSNPEDYARYELSHKANTGNGLWGRECPVHGPTARKFQRSDHMEWFRAREEYAKATTDSDRAQFYYKMLNYVSETCPPDVPYKESHLRVVKSEVPYSAFWAMIVVCIVIGSVIFAGLL